MEYEPTMKWERDQVATFSELRQMLARHKTDTVNKDSQKRPNFVSVYATGVVD